MKTPARPPLSLVLPGALILLGAAVWLLAPCPASRKPAEPRRATEGPAAPTGTAPSSDPVEAGVDPSLPLVEQRRLILRMDREEARAWLLRELEGGKDSVTGDDLEIGSSQELVSWPSYRTFLLDMLFSVDPDTAAAKSRELVESSESPDEWAVALRNVAKADDGGRDETWLRERAADLLRNPGWREDPGAGYLNAFDLIVHTRHTALSPELLEMADDRERRALRHAAFLALDRLVQASPEEMLSVVADSAARHPKSGLMISNLMARADLRDPSQHAALRRYLLDEARTGEELEAFAGVFPNANFHVSNNLLTRSEGLDGIEIGERDRAALEAVGEWLAEEDFERIRPALERIEERLRRFVAPWKD